MRDDRCDWFKCTTILFSKNRQYLAFGSETNFVHVLKTVCWTQAFEPRKGQTERVNCLSFDPDTLRLASGSSDGTIRVWNLADGQIFGVVSVAD